MVLVFDLKAIGNNLYSVRKLRGLTQAEVAERAEISDRSYADIERGDTTMRIDTLLKICYALGITPNDILTLEEDLSANEDELIRLFGRCSVEKKKTALKLLEIYLSSMN